MDEHLSLFAEKFRIAALEIHRDAHWVLSVRPEQLTLGAVVISSASGALSFSRCGAAALEALGQHFARLESIAMTEFGAIRLNILCLMMVDPVVHFHVIPRYDGPRDFAATVWTDGDWPAPVAMRPSPTDPALLQAVRTAYLNRFGAA